MKRNEEEKSFHLGRREFLRNTGVAALGAQVVGGLGGCSSDTAMNPTTDGDAITIADRERALVFIMLDGGNDSFNMLVPTTAAERAAYERSRSNHALDAAGILGLEGAGFGLHPSLPKVQSLYGNGELAFLANVGPLVEPVTKEAFLGGSARVPIGLLSHSDQFKHWQTSRPGERINQGWFGAIADVLQPSLEDDAVPMGISMAGSNIMQYGRVSTEYAITAEGSKGLYVYDDSDPQLRELNRLLRGSFGGLLGATPASAFHRSYLGGLRHAQAQHEAFQQATEAIRVNTNFASADGTTSPLAAQLKMVARAIKAGPALGHRQQTFFLRYIGWDHHDELRRNHARMLGVVDDALAAFQTALRELGIDDQVVTFTGSDFGRTLTSNGNGTDHGWGGNTLVMGAPVAGGRIYGEYPALTLGSENPLDVGGGVLIPTTATDSLYAELALWFGVAKGDLHKLFPNIERFYDHRSSATAPLGMLRS